MRIGIAVVIRGPEHLFECLESLTKQTSPPDSVVLCSSEHSFDGHRLAAGVQFLQDAGTTATAIPHPETAAAGLALNSGLLRLLDASVNYVVLVSQEVSLEPTWLASCDQVFQQDGAIGVVGSRLMAPNRLTIEHAGGYLERPRLVARYYGHPDGGFRKDFEFFRDVEFVSAAAMAVRAEALQSVGLLNDLFATGVYQEVDLCSRIRASGSKVVFAPCLTASFGNARNLHAEQDRALTHRDRFMYALPWLVEQVAREEFIAAERRFIEDTHSTGECWAIAAGALLALLQTKAAMVARLPSKRLTPELRDALIALFAGIRREALEVSHRSSPPKCQPLSEPTANPGLNQSSKAFIDH